MKLDEIYKFLEELSNGQEIIESIKNEISSRNKEAETYRKSKSELREAFDETSSLTSNEIKMLKQKVDDLTSVIEKEQLQKENALKESEVVRVLSLKNVKKNFDFFKNALVKEVERGETGLLIGSKSLEDYVQNMIDNDSSIVGGKIITETNKVNDLYSEEELSKMSHEELKKNKDKVKASLAALS